MHVGSMYGMDIAIWFMLGFSGYFLFTRVGNQCMNAVDANQTLFSYKLVKPVDTVITRACLESFIMTVTISLLLTSLVILGLPIKVADPILAICAWIGLGLLGLGYGLIFSVINELIPEIEKLLKFIMLPLYFLSGVLIPILSIPRPYYDVLMWNPIIHGVEFLRISFSNHYVVAPNLSLVYLYGFSLTSVFLGLALHVKFAKKLVKP